MFDHTLTAYRTASALLEPRSMHEDAHGAYDTIRKIDLVRSDQIGAHCLEMHYDKLIPSMAWSVFVRNLLQVASSLRVAL